MRSRILAVLAVLGVATASTLSAQNAAAWRDSARRIEREWRVLRDSMMQGDSSVVEVEREGNLVLLASPREQVAAREMFSHFTLATRRWFGDAMPTPDGFQLRLTVDRDRRANREPGLVLISGLPDTVKTARYGRESAPNRLGDDAIDLYGQMMLRQAPGGLYTWLITPPPFTMPITERRQVTMYGLVTGVGRIQKECVDGNIESCKQALLLQPMTGPNPGAYLPIFLHSDLFFFTLENGGPGAWDRMRGAAVEGAGPALAAAMQMPLDSVISRWRHGLLDIRPQETPWRASRALLAIGWLLAALLLTMGIARWA
jgi:hypothetical protein